MNSAGTRDVGVGAIHHPGTSCRKQNPAGQCCCPAGQCAIAPGVLARAARSCSTCKFHGDGKRIPGVIGSPCDGCSPPPRLSNWQTPDGVSELAAQTKPPTGIDAEEEKR